MHVIIMRHGDAKPVHGEDSLRPLSSFGHKQAKAAGKWLQHRYLTGGIDMCLVSPYVRARQTLADVSGEVNINHEVICNDVTPDGSVRLTHDYLDFLISDNQISHSLLIISHMPFVSYLVDELTGSEQSLFFDTSSIMTIEYCPEKMRGTLLEVYHPL
ncbi:MAG: phosphohistidine phosphatase [Paraglaciecola sp.]|jgi:phosphohistidine phosphatase